MPSDSAISLWEIVVVGIIVFLLYNGTKKKD